MSPREMVITWSEIAQKFAVPVLLSGCSLIGGWTATEISSMRQEIQGLKIRVAELSVELKMHREEKPAIR